MTRPPDNDELFIGLMSGTSLDGVDAVLVDFAGARPEVRAAIYRAFAPALRGELLALQASGADELHRMAVTANALVECYADMVEELLAIAEVSPAEIRAVGAHGQTVRHRPDAGYTSQINNPALLAERTGITVVADFRARDVAAGGQGAPLVPAFHAALFQDPAEHRVVVNIGGMANVTLLPPGAPGDGVTGWDTGPGNVLLDAWCSRHRSEAFDRDGAWAAAGIVDDALLRRLLDEPYFGLPAPKSTGRDLFGISWLESRILPGMATIDVQATLLRLTAASIAADVTRNSPRVARILVCGGGAYNGALMRELGKCVAQAMGGHPVPIQSTADFGVPANQVEALAFAWLARQALVRAPGNVPGVTGARGLRILGAVHPV
ncbi:MAG: anhydro-N-acetylmuramic acid kinase [Betaproteobacteria bacterium]